MPNVVADAGHSDRVPNEPVARARVDDVALVTADRLSQCAFGLLTLGVVFCVWWPDIPIGIDLPLHLTQIAQMQQWVDGQLPPEYEMNWATPYLLGYVAVLALWQTVPLEAAVKIVFTLAYLGLPLSLWWYLYSTGRDTRLSLLGFPAIFTAAYHWGLLNFVVAAPLVVLAWRYAEWIRDRHTTSGDRRTPWLLLPLSVALFYCHAIAWGLWGVVTAVLVVDARSLRHTLARWLPLVASTAVAFTWVQLTVSQYDEVAEPLQWPAWERLAQVCSALGQGDLDLASLVEFFGQFGIILTACMVYAAVMWRLVFRPGENWRWTTACGWVIAACVFAPSHVFGTALIVARLPMFLPVALALAVRPQARLGVLQRSVLVASCSAIVVVKVGHVVVVASEMAQARAVWADLPHDARLIYLPQDQTSGPAALQLVFLHYDGLIKANRPGVRLAFESSIWWPQVVRLRLAERARRLPELNPLASCREYPNLVERRHVAGRFDWALIRGTPQQIDRCLAKMKAEPHKRLGSWCLATLAPLQPGETVFDFRPTAD